MKKANELKYPESMMQNDWRTSPEIRPQLDVLSYGRQVRSAASKPDRIKTCPEVYDARALVNKY